MFFFYFLYKYFYLIILNRSIKKKKEEEKVMDESGSFCVCNYVLFITFSNRILKIAPKVYLTLFPLLRLF